MRKTMDRPILTPSKLRFKPPETSFRHWWISVARCRWLGTNQYHRMGTLTENGTSPKRHESSSFAINLQGRKCSFQGGYLYVFVFVMWMKQINLSFSLNRFGILQRCSNWISGFINFEGFEVSTVFLAN